MAAHHRRRRLAPARVGDVVHPARIDPCRLGDQTGEDVVDAARRAAGPAHRRGIAPEVLEQLFNSEIGGVGGYGDHLVLVQQAREGHRLLDGDRAGVGADGAEHHLSEHHQVARVAVMAGDHVGESDGAAGAAPVDDLHRNAEDAGLGPHLLDLARRLVPAAAGVGGRDERERPLRIARGGGRQRSGGAVGGRPASTSECEERDRQERRDHSEWHRRQVSASSIRVPRAGGPRHPGGRPTVARSGPRRRRIHRKR